MSRCEMNRLTPVLAVAVALLTLAAAVGYATIPDSSGVVHGCYNTTNGQLRVIDAGAGQTCKPAEAALNWNQIGPAGAIGPIGPQGPAGPQGPQGEIGPVGTALAYAHVAADGTIDVAQTSANVTVFRPAGVNTGEYCIGVTGGTVHAAVASLDSLPNVGGSVQAGVFPASRCSGSGSTDIYVVTRSHVQDGGLFGFDRAFYIIVN